MRRNCTTRKRNQNRIVFENSVRCYSTWFVFQKMKRRMMRMEMRMMMMMMQTWVRTSCHRYRRRLRMEHARLDLRVMRVKARVRLLVAAVRTVAARLLLGRLLRLVAMILEPDLHLRRCQAQGVRELIAILSVQVAILVEALLELHHLLLREQNATFALRREGKRMIGRLQRIGHHRAGSSCRLIHVVLAGRRSREQTRHYGEGFECQSGQETRSEQSYWRSADRCSAPADTTSCSTNCSCSSARWRWDWRAWHRSCSMYDRVAGRDNRSRCVPD